MQLYKIFHPFRILFPASSQSRYSIHRFCRLHTFERGRTYDHDRTSLGHFLVCLGRHLQRLLRFSMSGSPRLALYSYQLCMSVSNTFMKASDDILSTAKHYVHKDLKKTTHTYNYLHIIVHSVGVVLYEIHGRHERCIFPIHTVEILSQHRVLLDLNALLVFLEPAQRPDYRVPRQPRQLREVCRELSS